MNICITSFTWTNPSQMCVDALMRRPLGCIQVCFFLLSSFSAAKFLLKKTSVSTTDSSRHALFLYVTAPVLDNKRLDSTKLARWRVVILQFSHHNIKFILIDLLHQNLTDANESPPIMRPATDCTPEVIVQAQITHGKANYEFHSPL